MALSIVSASPAADPTSTSPNRSAACGSTGTRARADPRARRRKRSVRQELRDIAHKRVRLDRCPEAKGKGGDPLPRASGPIVGHRAPVPTGGRSPTPLVVSDSALPHHRSGCEGKAGLVRSACEATRATTTLHHDPLSRASCRALRRQSSPSARRCVRRELTVPADHTWLAVVFPTRCDTFHMMLRGGIRGDLPQHLSAWLLESKARFNDHLRSLGGVLSTTPGNSRRGESNEGCPQTAGAARGDRSHARVCRCRSGGRWHAHAEHY